MENLISSSNPKTNKPQTTATPLKVPRLDSLLHRLQHAKDANGQPIPLLDELLFFLDDPPQGTGDRWQQGAELCQSHGISTSRMSVWRLYRSHILQWRREQNPAPPEPPPTLEEMEQLQDRARHLAVLRVIDMLHDPRLSPGHLISFLQCDNHRDKIQLARDQFSETICVRQRQEHRDHLKRMENLENAEAMRKTFFARFGVTPHTTP